MEQLTWMLAGILRAAARLLPPGRRPWAEAVRAEAGQVPAGWPRLRWLAGGVVASGEGGRNDSQDRRPGGTRWRSRPPGRRLRG